MIQGRFRFPFLFLALLGLIAAMWAGWIRLGWDWPPIQPSLPASHGPLMVVGFLGTLIALERAVALRQRWMYFGPLLSGIGGLVTIIGIPGLLGPSLMALGSLVLVAILIVILRQHIALHTVAMALGATSLAIGTILLFIGWSIPRIVLWWEAFLVLTIAGERLELGRLLKLSKGIVWAFSAVTALSLLGLATSTISLIWGTRIFGLGLLGMAAWLLRYDIARHTIRQNGLARFAALSMLSGYGWLAIGGLLALIYGGQAAGPVYDALLHSVFIGFVMTMIFAHAPIIFPSILGLPISFSRLFYTHLILLHASLLLRIIGDLAMVMPLRRWGGFLNGIAILTFLVITIVSMLTNRERSI